MVFLSLKGVDGLTFEDAVERFKSLIQEEAWRLHSTLQDKKLSPYAREMFRRMENRELSGTELPDALKLFSKVLYEYYGQKVILLIDEYDVPLDKAFQHGYYREMVSLIRSLFGQALKTNAFLQFAVLTGCLRVSRESIFTGLNNFDVNSIADIRHDEHFGFTEQEVWELLKAYGLEQAAAAMKEWYDGYHFGNADVYCPWDVINYAKKLQADSQAEPQAFWINTSGNDLVKRFVDRADKTTQNEIERLIAGETIEKAVRLELTYDEIDNSIDNLWSVLFMTGYLTQKEKAKESVYKLIIPNREVREVFILQIQEWFKKTIVQAGKQMQKFCQAFLVGDDIFRKAGFLCLKEGDGATNWFRFNR